MRNRKICWNLAIVAGVVGAGVGSGTPARAQFSMGYDSFLYNQMPSETYWTGQGYPPMYTDPSLGVYQNGTNAPYRGLVPYMTPPFEAFPQTNGLPVVSYRPVATAGQQPRVVVKKKRGLIFRRNAKK